MGNSLLRLADRRGKHIDCSNKIHTTRVCTSSEFIPELIFSARVSKSYRSVGIMLGDEIIWFWISSHADYDRLVRSMRSL